MSADLVKTILLEDSRIAQLTAEECFAVQSSAQQSTYQQYNVTANSNSSLVWSVQIPSENIVIDRHALLSTDITFQITLGGASNQLPTGGGTLGSIFNYGATESVQAFPLQSLFTTLQATINNTSVSTNYQDVLPMLSRMYDKRQMSRWNSMTPSYADSQYANYDDARASTNNPLGDYKSASYDIDFLPRGAYPITFNGGTFTTTTGTTSFGPNTETPNPPDYITTNDVYQLVFTIKVTEPFLFLSPFINNNPENQAGLLGINNISLVANIDQSMKRFFSTANTKLTGTAVSPAYISNIQLGNTLGITGLNGQLGFGSTRLLLNFLSLSPEQYSKISTRNVINYMEYPRYLTQLTSTGALGAKGSATARQTISTSSIQLNQVPDLILVCGRIPMGQQTIANTSSFLTIKNISINFNNQSGLLASATTQDLYDISVENGSSQNFYEFNGSANHNNNTTGLGEDISTTGSLLVLNPVRDFSLPSYLSSSSLGQYQLQMNITFENQFPFSITPEIVIITANSGVFATTQGTSAIYTGILSKEVVLKTKEQNPVPHLDSVEYKRLVGGKLGNMGMSNIRALLKSHIKKHRSMGSGIGSPSSGGMHHPVRDAVKNKLMKHLM
jgi:hypothetical protein